jgi:hypothetical protein
MVDRELALALEDLKKGCVYGPFRSAREIGAFPPWPSQTAHGLVKPLHGTVPSSLSLALNRTLIPSVFHDRLDEDSESPSHDFFGF